MSGTELIQNIQKIYFDIDDALDYRNKELFIKLSGDYNVLQNELNLKTKNWHRA